MTVTTFSGVRVAGALASSALGQVVSVAQNFLLVPLFLSAWGDTGYGQWLSLTALTSYLALLDLGGQYYVGNQLAEAFAQERRDDFRRILREAFSVFAATAGLALITVIGVLLWPSAPWDASSRMVLFFSASTTALMVPMGVLTTCYWATGSIIRSTTQGNLSRLAIVAVTFFSLRAKFERPQLAAALLIYTICQTALVVLDLYKQVGDLFRPAFSFADLRKGLRILHGSLGFWMFALAGAMNLQGLVLVVSYASGNATVAQFATHRAAASLIVYVGTLLRLALLSEMTFMVARADMARVRDVASVAVRAGTWCAGVAGSVIFFAAPLVYSLWTRSKLELNTSLLAVLIVQAVLSTAWNTASWPLMSASRPRELARWSILNAVLTIVGAFACLRLGGGIWSVAAASLTADIVCGLIPFPLAAATFLRDSVWQFPRDLARALLCAIPFAAAAFVSMRLCDTNPMRLALFLGASAVLAWPALLALLGTRDLSRIRSALTRR